MLRKDHLEKESAARRYAVIGVLGAVFLSLVLSAIFLNDTFGKTRQQEQWVAHTWQVQVQLERVLTSAKDVETGIRGYLLTSDPDILQTYKRAKFGIVGEIQKLRGLVADNPQQMERLNILADLIEKRAVVLEDVLMQFERERSSRRFLYIIQGGKALVASIVERIDDMLRDEELLLERRSSQLHEMRRNFQSVLSGVTFLNISILLLAFYFYRRNESQSLNQRREQERKTQIQKAISDVAILMGREVGFRTSGENLLRFMSQKYNFLAGKIFILHKGQWQRLCQIGVNDDSGDQETSYGLVREHAKRTAISLVSEVPGNYWKISSSLGSHSPLQLVFIPIVFQGFVIGIIEFGAFSKLSSDEVIELDALQEVIGTSIQAAHSHELLSTLLEKNQAQTEELQTQQEELQANNEELEQQARTLEAQQETLNIKNKELEQIHDQLVLKADDLEKSSRYKSEFLAKMSHELRTPLNSLLILSSILTENKEKNLSSQQIEFVRSIHAAGSDLLVLINDILDLSKIEARKLTLKVDSIVVGDLLQGLKSHLEPLATSKGLWFKVEVPESVKALKLESDRQRLEQILRNFLSNAIKFTEKGGVSVRTTLREDGAEKQIQFSVRDTGVGVPKNKQDLIFEAFEQADSSISRNFGGTGLGLTISRELAHLLHGEIELVSKEGEGSEFSITLPVKFPDADVKKSEGVSASLKRIWEEKREASENLSGLPHDLATLVPTLGPKDRTILVIEDDSRFRMSVVEMVRNYGFIPLEAPNGEIAFSLLRCHRPSAILLDIKLPDVSGMAILEKLKNTPEHRHIPVHMISAMDYQQTALKLGASGYLKKPVTLEGVQSALGRIEKVLSQKVKNVLTIEDDGRQAYAVAELISGEDVKVENVSSGKQALEALKAGIYDCVILDLSLPDMTGFEFLEQLSRSDTTPPPIIVYTARDLNSKEEDYLRRYSESIIIKGAKSPERLLDEVNLFLHRFESLLPESQRDLLSKLRSQDVMFENKTALVVDDDIRNIFALTSALEGQGMIVKVAKNGIEALEQVKAHPEIDVVLMDIMMPQMDGYEAIRQIRQFPDKALRNVPIVALTAKAMKEDHEKCIEAGANDYLPKPIHLENLMTVLKVWLNPKGFIS